MNARRAARELALLTLFQLDRQGGGQIKKSDLQRESLQSLALASVRALSGEAEFQIQTAASDLASVSRALIDYEIEHPTNLESPIEAVVKPVPIPTTRDMVEKIEKCLQAAEFLHEALRIPELIMLFRQEEVQGYAVKLLNLVVDHQAELDDSLNKHLSDWRMDRLTTMDAYVLRLAAAEMAYVPNVDLSVSINEAVDLAKQFSTEESYRLVNGVLGSLAEVISQETGKSLAGVQRESAVS
ncbi:MAG TPA: transcription antitermination factor NusB [Oculatellaceae cyanobacterium]|jgi:N utilization substance protein B